MNLNEWQTGCEEKLLAALETADDASKITRILDDHLAKMLLNYNEQTADEMLQESAAQLVTTARTMLPLLECTGEVQIWKRHASASSGSSNASVSAETEDSGNGKSRRRRRGRGAGKQSSGFLFPLCLIAGSAFILAALITGAGSPAGLLRLPLTLLFGAAGGALLFAAGLFSGKGTKGAGRGEELIPHITYDSRRILSVLRLLAMQLDDSLAGMDDALKAAQARAGREGREDFSDREDVLSLCANLLEAEASGDGQYALDELSQVRYFLHRHQIELQTYSPEKRAMFEFVPSAEDATLRPALVHAEDGRLLKKGLAGVAS